MELKENSFEMWNSWVERDVIVTIKANVEKHINWFYLKKLDIKKDRDRMLNEELYTTLTYFEYKNNINNKIY